MGAVDGFKGAGVLAKITLIILLIAAVCAWVGFTNTGWGRTDNGVSNDDTFIGLWRTCKNSDYSASCSPIDGWALDWIVATQTLVTLGFLGLNLSLFLLILYMFVSSCQKNGELGIATALICIVTGVLYLIGVIVFAVKFKEDYIDPYGTAASVGKWEFGYAFALSVTALGLQIIGGVLLLLEACLPGGGTSPSG